MPNPILPAWEYIPDGEPRVFGDRVSIPVMTVTISPIPRE